MSGYRFDVTPLVRGHRRCLWTAGRALPEPDWFARAVFVIAPALDLAAQIWNWKFTKGHI